MTAAHRGASVVVIEKVGEARGQDRRVVTVEKQISRMVA